MAYWQQVVFITWFLAIIFVMPVSQAGWEIARGRRPQFLEVFRRTPTAANLRAYERQLEDASVYARTVRPWVQYVWFAVLRNPGEKVVVGRDGWLFYKPDIRYLLEPNQPAEPFAAILAFRDQLARRGIRLVVLPAPGKPSIYPDELTSRVSGNGPFRSQTVEFIARLRQAGVETPDLFEMFAQLRLKATTAPYYLLRDTHWSGEAARLAAEAVARRIRALGWMTEGAVEYGLKPVLVARRSDIARMIRLPGIEQQYPAEQVRCYQVLRRDTGELYADDPHSPVLVLGDSFLRMYQTDDPRSAGFIAHLARELKRPLASIVNDGGASTLVRQELSRRPALLEGKKLVIWEFVERDIRFGEEGWRQVPLSHPLP